MNPKLSDLWRWDGAISRGAFLFWGIALCAIKFNLDRIIGALWFDKPWSLFNREFLHLYFWQSPFPEADRAYFAALLAAALPFIWTGTVLVLRRLRSLGWSPFWVLLFFVPVLKLIFFAVLCLLPSRDEKQIPPVIRPGTLAATLPSGAFASAAAAILITAVISVFATWLGTKIFGDYGWSIFAGLPFCMGFLSALIHSFRTERSIGACILVANLAVALVGIGLVLFAIEGVICILMAAPIAFGVATIGGMLGYAVQKTFFWREKPSNLLCAAVVLLPVTMSLEHFAPPPLPLLQVKSSVIINAPPEKVWRNVVSFSELPPPHEMIFKLGIAYPIRAEIQGKGVGAVRHCNFSTGPFVEPIEVWDEPQLLKFSVTQNPEPMQEWTPYKHVHPPHLDGYLESCAGQFRLIPLEGSRTLLEGTTWYHHHLWPADYWQIWSDHIIHTIHLRVLNHVKQISEKDA